MQILQSWAARTQLPMSNVARAQQGLGSEQLRKWTIRMNIYPHMTCNIGQSVMYLNPTEQKMVSSHNHKPMPRT